MFPRRSLLILVFAAIAGCSGAPSSPKSATTLSPEKPAPKPTALASNATTDYVLKVENWDFGNTKGRVFTTPSYRIFTTSADSTITERIPSFAELALDHYRTAITPLPAPKIALDTYLMANRLQWTRLSAQLLGDDAGTYNMIQRGGFTVGGRAILYDIGTRDTFSIVAHEGWHQFTQRTFAEPLPMWLEEGIATYMEGYRWDPQAQQIPQFFGWSNVERFDQLRQAVTRNELIPLEKLLVSSPQELVGYGSDAALNYYSQVWALVHFLEEAEGGRYQTGFRSLVSDAAAGKLGARIGEEFGPRAASSYTLRRKGPEPFLIYFNKDLKQAQIEYKAFVDRITQTGAKEKIVMGRSPLL